MQQLRNNRRRSAMGAHKLRILGQKFQCVYLPCISRVSSAYLDIRSNGHDIQQKIEASSIAANLEFKRNFLILLARLPNA